MQMICWIRMLYIRPVVNGAAVAPYTEATSTSTGSTSYYMGGKALEAEAMTMRSL